MKLPFAPLHTILWVLLSIFLLPSPCQSQVLPDEVNKLIAPLPDPLAGVPGVADPETWDQERREEVLDLFRRHVYGRVPEMDCQTEFRVVHYKADALGGKARMKEILVRLMGVKDTVEFNILVFLPAGTEEPVPLFLGLNFYGNHTITGMEDISVTTAWVPDNEGFHIHGNRATGQSAGVRQSRWPVELILSRGFGLATVYCGEIDPDFDDQFSNGVHRLDPGGQEGRTDESWGTISAWAWGLSRCMDYFEGDAEVDHEKVAVIGHSRLGKTALWAGAVDERFALVVSNNSGCGGAALSRRPFGEQVKDINQRFPHWFAGRFHAYSENVDACPVDQHMLLGLVAPRPLYVASAEDDRWADPYGEYLSMYYAGGVYRLYGEKGFGTKESPPVNEPRIQGKLGYHIRSGGHDLTEWDWNQFLAFAERHLGGPAAGRYHNPVRMDWLGKRLPVTHPRMIITPEAEARLMQHMEEGDPETAEGLRLMREHASKILETPPLEFNKTGRRLLGVSREAIRRLTTMAFLYRIDREDRYLNRLEEELSAVSAFEHWNPSHFLDVAEMAAGVGLALDWAGEWIDPGITERAERALAEKALKPGLVPDYNGFTGNTHNWNLVCNGGLSLAAIYLFEKEPELCTAVLHQAVESMPLALAPYAPDGIYPEGPSYWFYATTYLTVAISAFESALGTDFGFSGAPGFFRSAEFSQVLAGPSGQYFNYFDAAREGYHSLTHYGLLAWFANRSDGNAVLKGYGKVLRESDFPAGDYRFPRFMAVHFLEILQSERQGSGKDEMPEAWMGRGEEPIGIFREDLGNGAAFYLAAKGGQASDNHGNMDAGSFILESEGVRWSVDPGNQPYHELEQIMGMQLWERTQESARWSLLTKNNLGHSTLTLDGSLHRTGGRATLKEFDLRGPKPEFSFDLSPLFGADVLKADRTFTYLGGSNLLVRDSLVLEKGTGHMAWQLVTTAEVQFRQHRVDLSQDGKMFYIHLPRHQSFRKNLVSLDPPPLSYDKQIPGLKRIELVPRVTKYGEPLEMVFLLSPNPEAEL